MASPAPPSAAQAHFTAADLKRIARDGLRLELVEGVLHEMAPAGGQHGNTTMNLSAYLNLHIMENQLGQGFAAGTGFLMARDPDTVLAPDFAFLSKAKLPGASPQGYVNLVPDLVLETHSFRENTEAKIARWLRYGVRVALLMNPSWEMVTVYQQQKGSEPFTPNVVLSSNDTLFLPEVLPGFSLPLVLVFHDEAEGETEETE